MSVRIALIGPGLVGSEVLRQIQQYTTTAPSAVVAAQGLTSAYPRLDVVAIANSRQILLSPTAMPLDQWTQRMNDATAVQPMQWDALLQHLLNNNDESAAIIVDCTSSDDVAKRYPFMLRSGCHVVTPNKKAFSSDLGLWREIVKLTVRRPGVAYPLCYHESTVGAGLPVISTLRDLMATGDRIMRIEGVFSGTLSYLFNTFSSVSTSKSSLKFSDIVQDAKAKGYTEPDPRDDLNGMDVARKVVILSRVANIDLSLESLPVQNVVPPELRSCPSIDDFMARLPESDDYFDRMNADAASRGEVLRYVGVVQDAPGKNGRTSEVALKSYPKDHPFAQLKGTDNIIAFYTERFSPQPLIIQGAGAGAAVTAHGVLSDLLKIAETVLYHRGISK